MPLFEYWCPTCQRRFEELRPVGTQTALCRCGTEATKRPARFALLNPPTGAGLRNSFTLFQEATQELDHHHQHAEADLERPLPTPNLWRRAKRKAQAKHAAGIPPAPTPLG